MSSMRVPLVQLLSFMSCLFLVSGCGTPELIRVDPEQAGLEFWQELARCETTAQQSDYVTVSTAAFVSDMDELQACQAHFQLAVQAAKQCTAEGQPLSGEALAGLHQSFAALLAAVRTISQTAVKHNCWRDVDGRTCAHHGINPPDNHVRVTGIALSAAASLAIFDTFMLHITLVKDDEPIRKALNQGDVGVGIPEDQVDGIIRHYISYGQRTRIYRKLRDIRESDTWWQTSADPTIALLRSVITDSPSGKILQRTRRIPQHEALDSSLALAKSDFREIGDSVMNSLSGAVGNAIGSVSVRRGKMADNPPLAAQLQLRLQPGDILLEKTPFRLTDRFIPGHWGHVAIWMGTETELRALGVWDDPLIQSHHDRITAGASVLEALRNGVQLNTLEHFLNIDDFCVLRLPKCSDTERATILRRGAHQIGKAYDFNFDVETVDRIVCSELVYQVYIQLMWPTDRTLGRWTISPDQVAQRALSEGPLEIVTLWLDGREITDGPEAAFEALIRPKP